MRRTLRRMELLEHDDLPDLRSPVMMLALDGWTDAGTGGTTAASQLRDSYDSEVVGAFDPDALFDYRDRRPTLAIDRGTLGDPNWPALELVLVTPTDGPDILLVTGGEPDFRWRAISRDLRALARDVQARRYVGLGAVPAPVPHTRPTRVIATGSDPALLERVGRPHERMLVPASCQVVLEAALRDEGLETLGLWARIPHYVAGEYPEASIVLLRSLGAHLGLEIGTAELAEEAETYQERLDEAAAASSEVTSHIEQLEELYDSESAEESGGIGGPLPTGDQIAAEFERFLRDRGPGTPD